VHGPDAPSGSIREIITKQERIMSDEINKKHFLSDDSVFPDEPDAELSTADLAGVDQFIPRGTEGEPPLEAEPESMEPRGAEVPSGAGRAGSYGAASAPAMERETGPLFSSGEVKDFRARWDAIQVGFVDEPRQAVEQADHLVAETMKRLAEIFAQERSKLEGQWDQGENVSTEDLRLALRRYRSFFSRLLSV
jgi:hypothetical protein